MAETSRTVAQAPVGSNFTARDAPRRARSLRWLVQQDGVLAIPKASSRAHLAENLAVFDFSLTDEEKARVHDLTGDLGRRLRNLIPSIMRRMPV